MRPQPFKCRMTPRSEEILQTIKREGEQALEDLSVYSGTTNYRMSDFYTSQKKTVTRAPV